MSELETIRVKREIARDTLALFAAWNCRQTLIPTLEMLLKVGGAQREGDARFAALYDAHWYAEALELWAHWRRLMDDLAANAFVVIMPGHVPLLYATYERAEREAERFATLEPPRIAPAGKLLWDSDGAGNLRFPGLVRIYRDRALVRARRSMVDV